MQKSWVLFLFSLLLVSSVSAFTFSDLFDQLSGNTITGNVISSSDVFVNVSYNGKTEDKTGPWSFSSGNGNDFGFNLHFNSPSGLKIRSMRFVHQSYSTGEYWDSSSSSAYPVVVFDSNNNKINSAYSSALMNISSGNQYYQFYIQPAYPNFMGGILTINLIGGDVITINVPATGSGIYGSYTGSQGGSGTTGGSTQTGTSNSSFKLESSQTGSILLYSITDSNGQIMSRDNCFGTGSISSGSVTCYNLPMGNYNLLLGANGYYNQTISLSLSNNQLITYTLNLLPVVSPTLSCIDSDGVNYNTRGNVTTQLVSRNLDIGESEDFHNIRFKLISANDATNVVSLQVSSITQENIYFKHYFYRNDSYFIYPSNAQSITFDKDNGESFSVVSGSDIYLFELSDIDGSDSSKNTTTINNIILIDKCLKDAKTLIETMCSSSKTLIHEVYSCPNGCFEGACVNPTTPTSGNICIESDGGINFNVRGQVQIQNASGAIIASDWDDCEEELFCNADGTAGYAAIVCPNGCSEGACLTTPQPTCDNGCYYKDKCIPFGTRVLSEDFDAEILIEGYHDESNEAYNITVYSSDSAHMQLFTKSSDGSLTSVFNSDLTVGKFYRIQTETYKNVPFTVDSITPATAGALGRVEIIVNEQDPMYCSIEGTLDSQRNIDDSGNQAMCQNNYECESNVCSSGQCVDVNSLLEQGNALKSFFVKAVCALINPFNQDQRNQCVADNLG